MSPQSWRVMENSERECTPSSWNTTCQISPKCNGGCLSSLHTLTLTVRAIMMPILKLDSIELIYNWYGTLMNSKVIHESERAGGMESAPRRRLRRAKACKSWCEMVHISWEIKLSGNSQKKNSERRHIQNTMPYHYLGTPSQSAVTKCHIFWWMSMTDCDFSKNRSLSIHHFFWWRKAEIGWIRPRRPCLKFCGKRFCGRA